MSRLQSPRRLFERQMNRNLWAWRLRPLRERGALPSWSPSTTAMGRAEGTAAGCPRESASTRVLRPAGMDSLLDKDFVWAEETSYVRTEDSGRTTGSTSSSGTTLLDAPGGTSSARES